VLDALTLDDPMDAERAGAGRRVESRNSATDAG